VERLQRLVGWKVNPAPIQSRTNVASPASLSLSNLAKRLRRTILSPLYFIQEPLIDDALYWSLRIIPLAKRIVDQEKIDVIMTTSAPWSSLLTGLFLKNLTGRPWVADFRDLWTTDPNMYSATGFRRWLDKRIEHMVINRADTIISVTQPMLDDLQKRCRRKQGIPFVLIPNGWDKADFEASASAQVPDQNQTITLLHPGSTYLGEVSPILDALERLSNCKEVTERLRFHFIGYMHPDDQTRISKSSLNTLFRVEGQRVSHPTALRLMKESHVLLLLLRNNPMAYSGKVFEYMPAGKPVLAIAEGVAARLVQQSGIGCVVSPNEPDRLSVILHQIALHYPEFVEQYYHPNWQVIGQYDRRMLTGALARVLESVARKI